MRFKTLFSTLVIGCLLLTYSCNRAYDSDEIRLFKEKVYKGYFAASILGEAMSDAIEDYNKGKHYYYDFSMNNRDGEYCSSASDAADHLLSAYSERMVVDGISCYLDEARDRLPDGDDNLSALYQRAKDIQRLVTRKPSNPSTFKKELRGLILDFSILLSESDKNHDGTKVDEQKANKETLKFLQTYADVSK